MNPFLHKKRSGREFLTDCLCLQKKAYSLFFISKHVNVHEMLSENYIKAIFSSDCLRKLFKQLIKSNYERCNMNFGIFNFLQMDLLLLINLR